MNYTKTIREYCKQNAGKIFDVSYEIKYHFDMVPYKTLLKVLNRLEEEGIVKTISKGVYLINSDKIVGDPIINHYAGKGRGFVIGYSMYNKYGITDHQEKPVVILTNVMETTTKNIGDEYMLINFPVKIIYDGIQHITEALEIIDNSSKIIDKNEGAVAETLIKLLARYTDFEFKSIIKARHYQFSTICTLETVLKDLNISNSAVRIYKEVCLSNA